MRQEVRLVLALIGFALPAPALAQAERYELGQRLKRFEVAWDKQPDPAARKRALAVVEKASRQFLSFQLGEAGRTLDEARFALADTPPSDAERWLTALYPVPEKRYFGSETPRLTVEVRSLYKVKGDPPSGASAWLRFDNGPPVEVPLGKLPASVVLPVPASDRPGEHRVILEALLDGRPVRQQAVSVSRDIGEVRGNNDRFEQAVRKACGQPPKADTIERATLLDRLDLLKRLAGGAAEEADYPVTPLATQGGHIAAAVNEGKPFFTPDRSGQFWLTVPTGKNVRTACRLFVPKGLDPKKPVPIVVALHGAGGSENLFFEGYGNGHIVKECEKRGWLLLAPRSGLGLLGGPPPVAAIVAELAARYPIDRTRVFLVGHSMGASQAVEAVQQNPGTFAAAAMLGGTGRVRKPEAFAELPLFVGVGTKDFALAGARSLHKALVAGGAKHATLREYPDLEHLVIVREALPDVFAMFDQAAK